MMRWPISVLLAVLAILVLPAFSRSLHAEEPEAEETTQSPQAVPGAAVVVRPSIYLGYGSARTYVVPVARPYRRGPLPAAVGVYIGPRTFYAGVLAPWGSFPPALYAASVPLPLLAARPADYGGHSYGQGVTVYRPSLDPTLKQPPTTGSDRSTDESAMPKAPEPATGPETIPAPQPFDVPNSGGYSPRPRGGLVNPTPPLKPRPPAPRPAPWGATESGPREF